MSSDPVKIYIRNSKKFGKILNLDPNITANDLYREAAATQGLSDSDVQLYLAGRLIPNNPSALQLKQNSIVHIINLIETTLDSIEINIRALKGRTNPLKIATNSSTSIRQFIDDKLYDVFGLKSDKLFLVHIGRQLRMEKSFREEFIEDGSEIFCVNVEDIRKKESTIVKEEGEVVLPVRDLQVAEEPKSIYPAANFLIQNPTEINANSKMDLVFKSNVHHSTSLPNFQLPPDEVIPEQQASLVPTDSEKEKYDSSLQKAEPQAINVTEDKIEEGTTEAAPLANVQSEEKIAVAEAVQPAEQKQLFQVDNGSEEIPVQQTTKENQFNVLGSEDGEKVGSQSNLVETEKKGEDDRLIDADQNTGQMVAVEEGNDIKKEINENKIDLQEQSLI